MCGVYVFFQPSFGSACGKYSWTCLTVCLKWWAISLHSTPVHVILTCAWTCGHALHPKKYGKWSIYIYYIQHISTFFNIEPSKVLRVQRFEATPAPPAAQHDSPVSPLRNSPVSWASWRFLGVSELVSHEPGTYGIAIPTYLARWNFGILKWFL